MLERLITSFQNILKIPELRSRVLFTLAMLAVYRIGAHIPTPGLIMMNWQHSYWTKAEPFLGSWIFFPEARYHG